MRRPGEAWGKRGGGGTRQPRLRVGTKGLAMRLLVATVVVLFGTLSLFSNVNRSSMDENSDLHKLWKMVDAGGWRPSSDPRTYWPPPTKSNGYLSVRCNGGLNQQRGAICNAVVAARIMNATLILPELDTDPFWGGFSGFSDIYDVEHFISSLRYDVQIVKRLPEIHSHGKKHRMKVVVIHPPRYATLSWYMTEPLEKMKKHGAVHLTPYSHRMAEELDDPELQRLRCRVNYHSLRFNPQIMELSNSIVHKLRTEGHFMAIHLRFEIDMVAFSGCFKIFNLTEQKILKEYRQKHYGGKEVLIYEKRKAAGKCPLTPEEVGLVLRSMGFDDTTRIYLAAGELVGGERFMEPFRKLFPRIENHNTMGGLDKLEEKTRELVGPAVDYMVCLLADIFMPTYDGPSNFANNIMGHRLYHGFRTTIQPDRKALAPIFLDREQGRANGFEEQVRQVMYNTHFGGMHPRVPPESFYTNSWPECFCQISAESIADRCPPGNVTRQDITNTSTSNYTYTLPNEI